MTHRIHRIVAILCALNMIPLVMAQSEANGWGGMRGIRMDGELIPFTTSLKAVRPDWKEISQTASEQVHRPHFLRDGNKQIFTGGLAFKDGKTITFTQTIEDIAAGTAKIDVQLTTDADVDLQGVYFYLALPLSDFTGATAKWTGGSSIILSPPKPDAIQETESSAPGIRITAAKRQLEIVLCLLLP
jgi:hypothetical protein